MQFILARAHRNAVKSIRVRASLLLLVALIPAAAADTLREDNVRYTVGSPGAFCPLLHDATQGAGSVCLTLDGTEVFLSIGWDSTVGPAPPGAFGFFDANGEIIGRTSGSCGGPSFADPLRDEGPYTTKIPDGAARLIWWALDPVFARTTLGCFAPTPPTTGELHVVWRTTFR